LVPVNLTTNGVFKFTSFAALIIPSASKLHFKIPPKILIKIVFTFGCPLNISKAVFTYSTFAPPPTSRKFAGSPLIFI
jgi:hypothetical protein